MRVILALLLLLVAAPVRAESGPRVVAAHTLSVSGAAAGLTVLYLGLEREDLTLSLAGSAALIVLPALGHWSVGEHGGSGMLSRLGGTLVFVAGGALFYYTSDTRDERDGIDSTDLAISGLILAAGGLVGVGASFYTDWLDLDSLDVQPLLGGDVAGLRVGGTF